MLGDYLLIIDTAPVDKDLKEYFLHFNIEIIQKSYLDIEHHYEQQPLAIIISSSILKKNPGLISELYKNYQLPLLISGEEPNDGFSIQMLEEGADDFMLKPLYPRELHARIKAIKRRVTSTGQTQDKEILSFMQWRVYPASRQLFNQSNEELFLSAGEYELLLIFLHNPQKILDREFLLQLTKNVDLSPFDRRIDVQISRLRQKIENDAKKPTLIKTIRNAGYIFTATVATIR
ncbi:winged helix-turn-helix domain-containing protein [Legionella sp. km772]|uniref:winged helix-turn-helix domain-containing protein n=1 Tax=Legionella sp. km772 TaxID=2498111 RepID=UPI000F8E2383|nr:winged helix-turn-helix domain-containing protein [Legionella sp. km772]RUR06980.1 DNA-binding response regulator [Legionella sp. km772]